MNSTIAADPCHRSCSATDHCRDPFPILAPITVLVHSVDRVFWCCFSLVFVLMSFHCFPLRTMRVGRFDTFLLVLLVSFFLHSAVNKQKEVFQSNLSGVIREKMLCEGFPLAIESNAEEMYGRSEFRLDVVRMQRTSSSTIKSPSPKRQQLPWLR